MSRCDPDVGYAQDVAYAILQVILMKLTTSLIRFLVIQSKVETHFAFILNIWYKVCTLLEPADFLNSSNREG